MKRIYIYLILLITVSSLIVPCFCLDTKNLPEGIVECINSSDIPEEYLEGLSNANYYILIKRDYSPGSYELFYCNSPIVFYGAYNIYNRYNFFFKATNSEDVLYTMCFNSSDGVTFNKTAENHISENGVSIQRNTDVSFYQCNYDVLDDKTGEVIYTVPTILEVATKRVSFDGILQEVVNLLPIVLVVVVGLIGIRKGIRFIKSNLIKS